MKLSSLFITITISGFILAIGPHLTQAQVQESAARPVPGTAAGCPAGLYSCAPIACVSTHCPRASTTCKPTHRPRISTASIPTHRPRVSTACIPTHYPRAPADIPTHYPQIPTAYIPTHRPRVSTATAAALYPGTAAFPVSARCPCAGKRRGHCSVFVASGRQRITWRGTL